MKKAKKRAPAKSAQSPPSAQKKTSQRGSQKAKERRRAKEPMATSGRDEELAALKADLLAASEEQRAVFIRAALLAGMDREFDELANECPELKQAVDEAREKYVVEPRDLLEAVAEANSDASRLLGLFIPKQPQSGNVSQTAANAARQMHAIRAIDDFIQVLRTALEPEPGLIPRLAEAIERCVAMLVEAAHAAGPDHQDKLAEALPPAARAAAALTKFVNGPCAELAPYAHAAGRGASDCWPRIHYANARRNTETEEVFRSWKIGADLPRKPAKQDRQTHNAVARDRTLEALCQLLPETMRRCYPVLPLLFDRDEKPIAPRTETGRLAGPYKTLAEFIVIARHSETAEPRAKALRDFLAANDDAAARLPKKARLRTEYARTRKRLAADVKRMDAKPNNGAAKAPPAPAWLRRTAPLIAFANSGRNPAGSRNKSDILRAHSQRILANALAPIYSRMRAELDTRDAIKTVIATRTAITGKGKTGRDSAAAGYISPHLDNLRRLKSLPESKLREIADEARAEIDKLEQLAQG